MFWCSSCTNGPCIIDPYLFHATGGAEGPTSYSRINRSKRIDKIVRIPESLETMKKASLTVSRERVKLDTPFNGKSDRAVPSVNPITKSKGVDQKHDSYARYLALKKGNLIRSDQWKYVGTSQIGSVPYTPYSFNTEASKECCCNKLKIRYTYYIR